MNPWSWLGVVFRKDGNNACGAAKTVPACLVLPYRRRRASRAQPLNEKHRFSGIKICLELGGYYLKAGQMVVGTRLLPGPIEEELAVLQDDVPARPFPEIRAIVEAELGCPVREVFATFEEKCLGAASIGQAHRATLRDGTEVVVKVQYPDVEKCVGGQWAAGSGWVPGWVGGWVGECMGDSE